MPEFNVTVRYTISFTGNIDVKAKDDTAATAKVEKLFKSLNNLEDFEKRVVKAGGEAELETEECAEYKAVQKQQELRTRTRLKPVMEVCQYCGQVDIVAAEHRCNPNRQEI